MRTLIPILALVIFVGAVLCADRWLPGWYSEEKQELDIYALTNANIDLTPVLSPCPPCPPDTVTLLVKIDSTTYYDGGTEHHWSYVVPDTVMPPGRWVSVKVSDLWPMYCVDPHIGKRIDDNVYLLVLPDSVRIGSVFILKGE